MRNAELLGDLRSDCAKSMHRHVDKLDGEALAWRPDAQGNSIGLTVWHVSRWMDLLAVVVLQGRSPDEERWHTNGWRDRTGYDPRGIGFNGFGVITGYSVEEAQAIPAMEKADLLAYFDATVGALRDVILGMSDEALYGPAPGSQQGLTAYAWIKTVLLGELGHAGEIEALIAMKTRRG